jgi:hypothetical protein
VAGKKRNSGKGKGQRRGISGNPQRRAGQLAEQRQRSAADDSGGQGSDPALLASPHADTAALQQLVYRMGGGAEPAPWWAESHQRVLARARAADWPDRPAELEDLTCQIVGGELYDCFEAYHEGHHPAQWLVRLGEETGTALRAAVNDGLDDWRTLWSLLCGIALTTPRTPAKGLDDVGQFAREMFPGIKDPHETTLAEAASAAKLIADRGLAAGTLVPPPDDGCRAAGAPLVARDVYRSRFLLAAPFRYGDETVDHWYAWDIDACWIDAVVGAGTFGSPDEALSEWRGVVGPGASGAELSACGREMATRLLRKSLQTGAFSDMIQGDEPRELIREYYRERRRARELSMSLGTPENDPFTVDMDRARDEFLDWYAARNGRAAVSPDMADAVDSITDQWGPHKDIDPAAFYACSPHRVEMAAHLISNGLQREYAAQAIKLLPDWTQWCIERSGLSGEAAARARGAALNAAATPVGESGTIPDPADSHPFRREE